MKEFTILEFREALFSLPSLVSIHRETVMEMFLKEKITRRILAEINNMEPYTFLRETFLSDAIANLLDMPKQQLNVLAGQHRAAIWKLFDTRLGWTSEEWAFAFLNFASLHLTAKEN